MVWTTFLLLVLYFFVVLSIGFISKRKAQTGEGHAIATHKASLFRVGASLFTLLGGGELVTMGSLSYTYSYAAMWFFAGIAAGFVTLALMVSKIRKDERVQNYTGLADFFRERFGSLTGSVASLLIVISFGSLLMIQYMVGGQILKYFLGWPYPIVVIVMSGIMVLYLTMGGFEAVLNTDVLQAVVMIGAAGLIVAGSLLSPPQAQGIKPPPVLNMPPLQSVIFFFPAWLAIVGSADVWQIIFSAKSSKIARTGLVIAAVGFVVYGVFLSYLGNLTRIVVPNLPNPDDAFATAIGTVLPRSLLPCGIILIFAAVMSTADTEIFVITRAIVREFSSRASNALNLDSERKYTQAGISYIAIIWAILAILTEKTNLPVIYFAIVGLALALSPAMIASWWFKPPPAAVALSMVAALLSLLAFMVLHILTPMNAPLVALISSVGTLSFVWLFSQVFGAKKV